MSRRKETVLGLPSTLPDVHAFNQVIERDDWGDFSTDLVLLRPPRHVRQKSLRLISGAHWQRRGHHTNHRSTHHCQQSW